MALQKQSVPINFGQGLDQKSDPWQVPHGKFLALTNTVFNKTGLLQKRNGFLELPSLPTTPLYTTTFNGNLTAIGDSLLAYSSGAQTWVSKGTINNIDLETLPLIRAGTTQTQCDSAVSPNGLICTVYTDIVASSATYKYAIADATTGVNVISPAAIPITTGAITSGPRVFVLANYFIIMFVNTISGTEHLQYVAVNINDPTIVSVDTDISTQVTAGTTTAFDGVVTNNNLYVVWNGSDIGGALRVCYITSTLAVTAVTATQTGANGVATLVTICADTSQPTANIWVTWYNFGNNLGFTKGLDLLLNTIVSRKQIIAAGTYLNLTSSATGGVMTAYVEENDVYSYDSGIATNMVRSITVNLAGTIGSLTTLVRGAGLASKIFLVGSTEYFLCVYNSPNQPTYFLSDQNGHILSKLAYSNASGYLTLGLPSVTVTDDVAQLSYLIKDSITPVNKTQGAANSAEIYSNTGVNQVTFTFGTSDIVSAEIGSDLHLSGGLVWQYDGVSLVEQGFHLWPDYVEITTTTTTGHLAAQIYYYQVTYEWVDNQANIFRSAPSIPVIKDLTGAGTSTSKNTINVPTLRISAKTGVNIVLYRWSTAQQIYYKATSAPNDPTQDSVAIVDTFADATIAGNNVLYTTGGVVENIGPPASSSMTLYRSRLFSVDAEDRNLIWFSKQVIQATPVEMSDLFTIYVAPTIGGQGSTGPITALSTMDDKLIIFKRDAIYYITGTGPDNTGANNDFSDAVFITSVVGCSNQQSIVSMPEGLMFQSDKGIWLLGRNLSTSYLGAPVEDFALENTVNGAVTVPGTNQVRFTLSNGVTLMYDYYMNQWGSFMGVRAISGTIFNNLHTVIDSYGRCFQENPGSYLDGSNPVLISLTTGWFNLAGLQGFERFYEFFLIGKYFSPHFITVGISYDYNPAIQQSTVITPDNYTPSYGGAPIYGNNSYGGDGQLEQWEVFPDIQKCQAFQLTLTESFDSTIGAPAGAGFTLSGLNLIVGLKGKYPTLKASTSVG